MEQKDLRVTNALLGLLVMFALGVLLHELQSVLLPFVLALFLSYIFKPVVLFLRKWRVPSVLALLVVLIVISGLFFGLGAIIYASIESFVQEAPKYQEKLARIVRDLTLVADDLAARIGVKPENVGLTDLVDVSALTGIITASAGSFVSGVGNSVLVILLMFFILAGSGNLSAKVRHAFAARHSERLAAVIEGIDRKVRQYLIAKTLISLGTGAVTTIILLLFGVDFALLWGFLTFLLNFIPNFGSIVSVIFPVVIALLQFDSASSALILLVLLVATQMVMGNVIEPKLMEFSLDLSPLLVLVALIFWGWLWGVWGMILAVPMMSILKIIFENVDTLRPIGMIMSGKIPGGRNGAR
ncbi:MAG: AI-2E family transporter [Bacteroidota bacterium]|jgi:predicted PurR-regulated permease PerM|nr:AI-2E family transporter [Bacteroidota bacterium]